MPANNKKSRLRQNKERRLRSKKGSSNTSNTTDNTKIHCRYGMECRDPNCKFFHHPMAAKDGVSDEKTFYALMKQKEKTAAALAAKAEAKKEAAKKAERNDPTPLVGSKEYALMKQSEKDFPPLSTSPAKSSSTPTSASILPICTEVGRPSVRHLSTPNSRMPTATTKKKCRWGSTCGDKHCTFLHPGQVFDPPAVITPKQLKSMADNKKDDVDQPPSMSSVLSQMIANAPQPHSVLPPTNWTPDRHSSVQPVNDVLLAEYERAISTSTPPEAPVWTPDRHSVQPVSSVAVTTPPLLKIVSTTNLDSTSTTNLDTLSSKKGMAECVMQMSPKVVGWVIGQGGSRIKDIMNECGAKIWIDQESMAESEARVVYVGGLCHSVQQAVQRIKEMVLEAPISVISGIDPGDAISSPSTVSTTLTSKVLELANTPPSASTTQTDEDWERFRMQKNVKSTRPPLSASDITLLQRIIIEGRHIGKEPGTLKSHVGTMLKQTGPQKFENKAIRQEFIAQAIDMGVVYESGEGGHTSLHLCEDYENNLTTNMWGVIIDAHPVTGEPHAEDGGGLKEPPRASPTSVQASEAILYKQVWGDNQAYEGAAATMYDQGAVFPYPEESSGVIPSPPRTSPASAAPSSDGILYKSTMWGSQQEEGAANYGMSSYDQGVYNYPEESKVSTPPGLASSLAPASEKTFGAIHDVFAKLGDPAADYGLDNNKYGSGDKSYTPLYNKSSTSTTLLTPSAFQSLESAFKPMPGETKLAEESDEGSPFLFKYSY